VDQHWDHLATLARRITRDFPDAVFIGGVAVAQHATRHNPALFESSHDADLYLSLAGKSEMRDRYEVSRNERLGKDSALIEGEDFDLYIERQHRLAVTYEEVFGYAEEVDGVRVAALEHLLVLKLDAARDRWNSAKGEKDVRDLARIVTLLRSPRVALLKPHLGEERLTVLRDVARQGDVFERMGINAHDAGRFRRLLKDHLAQIVRIQGPAHGLSI